MVNLGVFILTWTVFSLFGDFKRIPELLPTAIFAGFLALLTDIIMVNYELWSYSDLLISDEGVKLLLGFGLYFVVSYLYIQYIPSELKKILLYTFCWSLFAIAIEISYLNFEIMDHHKWWKLWTSYTADWLIFGLIYVQHRYYTQVKFRKKIRFRHYYSTMLTMSYLRFLEQYVLINMADVWVYHRLPLPISKIIHIPIMLDVTIYPLLGYLFIRFVPKRPVYTLLYYFIAALALLLVEFGLVFTGYLEHLNEWNFILSYYLAFSTFLIVHWQYKLFVLILPAVNDSSKIV